MKVNMLEARNQLSRLVKDALAGEEVVIASKGEPMVKLVRPSAWLGQIEEVQSCNRRGLHPGTR